MPITVVLLLIINMAVNHIISCDPGESHKVVNYFKIL